MIFLEALLSFMDTQRATRLIAHRSWTFLRQSPPRPALEEAQIDPEVCGHDPDECKTLLSMMDSAHLNQDSMRVCWEDIDSLQWCFNLERASSLGTRAVFAWPALLSPDFTNLLRAQTPEALVILLHLRKTAPPTKKRMVHRRCWAMLDSMRERLS